GHTVSLTSLMRIIAVKANKALKIKINIS
ncbi:hypothetical protein MNBD_GAMMA10-1230, partial [hydrothermal vent metagenome]